jgi:hypothetical protein
MQPPDEKARLALPRTIIPSLPGFHIHDYAAPVVTKNTSTLKNVLIT